MLHNYVPSGNGRDNFIFNDDVFKYGRQGIYSKLNPISKTSHDLEFWKGSEKRCQKVNKRPPIQFMKFPTESKPVVDDPRPYMRRAQGKEETRKVSNTRPVISGYQGHVQNQQFVVGKPQHRIIHDEEVQKQVSEISNTTTHADEYRETKYLPEEDDQISLPSFQRMKLDVLKKRLNQISGDFKNKDHIVVDALQSRVNLKHKPRELDKSGFVGKKYPSGYSGHVPRRYLK